MMDKKGHKKNKAAFEQTNWYLQLCHKTIDWELLAKQFPFVPDMVACPQDSVFHAEGNVWIHTQMVVEAMKTSASFKDLPIERQQVLLVAALMHDIAKPVTTVHEWDETLQRERVRQPNHSRIGAHMAWQYLTEIGAPTALKGAVYWLIFWHQRPFHLWHAKNMLRFAINYSCVGLWQELLCLVEADNRGRISPNTDETADSIALLAIWLQEQGIFNQAWPFANTESRMQFFEKNDRFPYFTAQEEKGSHVILLCGLAGSGKDTYATKEFNGIPHITLDTIRQDLGISVGDKQGAVIQAAYEQARIFLRAQKPFVWNATNITTVTRSKVISLFRDYRAYVEIHAIDKPLDMILAQNKNREAVVPIAVIERMLAKYEPPSLIEAHEVHWV